jgi:hypothetical protein
MKNELRVLYPTANDDDIILQDDGGGVYIKYWNENKLGAKPTIQSLILSVASTATILNDNTAADKLIADMLPDAVFMLMNWAESQATGPDKSAIKALNDLVKAEKDKKK